MKRLICSTGSYKRGLRSHINRWDAQFKALLDTVILSMSQMVFIHMVKLGGCLQIEQFHRPVKRGDFWDTWSLI